MFAFQGSLCILVSDLGFKELTMSSETCALLGYYAASSGKSLPTFRSRNVAEELPLRSLIKNIMIRGGVWPSTHDELVTTYLNAFAKFIKDIDFQKLQ